jgi:fructokinase
VVTCGGDGAALWRREGGLVTHAGCKVTAVDAVGAGDAFLASLLDGLLKGEARLSIVPCASLPRLTRNAMQDAALVLARANAVGAFVATQHGATPPLDTAAIQALMAASPPAVHA